ncbi:hypothetical protein TSUD_249860 [Trifolium subterraneum]|nr:hypothetical protein TSUD_249860 [Trifolium subterraneum]
MESENPNPDGNATELINSFIEITSSTQQEALFFLESHNFDLDAAVSSFLDNNAIINNDDNTIPLNDTNNNVVSPSDSLSPDFQPSDSPSRSPSPSPSRTPYELRSRRSIGKKPSGSRQGGIRTLRDVKRDQDSRSGSDSESDDPQEYYTGGQKSGMLVQDPTKGGNSVDDIFDQARQVAVDAPTENSSRSRSFTGTARLLSGEALPSAPQPVESITHLVTFWRNGFSVDDGPLRRLDDPRNASFLEVDYLHTCKKADVRQNHTVRLVFCGKAVRGSKEQSWKMMEAVMMNRDGNSDDNGDMIGFLSICPLAKPNPRSSTYQFSASKPCFLWYEKSPRNLKGLVNPYFFWFEENSTLTVQKRIIIGSCGSPIFLFKFISHLVKFNIDFKLLMFGMQWCLALDAVFWLLLHPCSDRILVLDLCPRTGLGVADVANWLEEAYAQSIKKSECPKELEPTDRKTSVRLNLTRRDENYPEPAKPRYTPFRGVGRTLGDSSSSGEAASEPIPTTASASSFTAPAPALGLVVDESRPVTSIQLRLADGTRMVSHFNHHHTIRDVRAFIDASRSGGVTSYQLQTMGFPPKQLTDLDQTIELAGIANSVVIQKL